MKLPLDGSGSTPITRLIPHFIGIFACFSLVFLFSGLEAGLLSINRIWLSEQVERKNRRAALLQEILKVPSRIIAVMLTMETTCSVVLAVLWTIVGNWGIEAYQLHTWVLIPWSALLILIIVTMCEIIPKALFAANSERVMIAFAPIAYVLIRVIYVIARLMELLAYSLIWLWTRKWITPKSTTVTEEDLMTMVSVGEDEGVIEEQEREMIHSIFEFGDLVAREIMVPRVDMVALDINADIQEAIELIVKHGHSRIPVYDGSPDRIMGLLYAKDLLQYIESGELFSKSLAELIRADIFFVPGTKDLSSLLEEMQARKAHMAIVTDEYGGTAGLVTIEDILEEIVGEIQDEYDHPSSQLVVKNPDGSLTIDASLGLHDFDDEVGIKLPAPEGVETIGGLLYSVLGKIPSPNETIEVKPIPDKSDDYGNSDHLKTTVLFKILTVEKNRIRRVQVNILANDRAVSQKASSSQSEEK